MGALMGGGYSLLRGYPSGHKNQAILASRLVGVSADRLVIGTGASELIAGFLEAQDGRALEPLPQYGAAYEAGLDRLRLDRAHLFEQLAAMPFLAPWPSAANFVLCEVRAPWTAAGLTNVQLKDHHIMIKDCSEKRGANDRQLVRIAVGTRQQTERLGIALAACA